MIKLILLITISTGAIAEHITLNNIADKQSNLLFRQLPQYRNIPQTSQELFAAANAANAVLRYIAPQIKQLPDYTGIFTGNCSMFFNDIIEQVSCDINPAHAQTLTAGAEIARTSRLPKEYLGQIKQSHILLANIFADWTGRKSQEFDTDLYFKVADCSQTVAPSKTTTPSHTASDSMSMSMSLSHSPSITPSASTVSIIATATHSFSRNLSKSLYKLSRTPSDTFSGSSRSPTLSASLTPTSTASFSLGKTNTHSNSFTTSRSRSNTHSFSSSNSSEHTNTPSLTQSISVLLSKTATDILSASQSSSNSASLTKSSTQSDTTTTSKTISKTPTFVPSGLFAVWSKTSGVYADSTNQASRYIESPTGVVTDTLTQLKWEKTASATQMDAASAKTYCASRTTGGLTGWEAPNLGELQTLVDFTIANPAAPINASTFPSTPADPFWSSTATVGNVNPGDSWTLSFNENGRSLYNLGTTVSWVRCVQPYRPGLPSTRYTVGSDIVTDKVTGLVWQKTSPVSTVTQSNASSYCSNLNLGGFSTGWRLPTIRELSTLVDYNLAQGNLMMDANIFAGEPAGAYWSSTISASSPSNAWSVNFSYGDTWSGNSVNLSYRVRCAR